MTDAALMRRAVRLARKGLGQTSPNPPVGAVVVDRSGRVVGEGWHRRAGGPHAEIVALEAAGPAATGGTLYVTLEPCNHHGRTPPCTDTVLRSGVRRVVVGARDPNPRVRGRGMVRLRRAGRLVELGVEEAACHELIAAFTKHTRTGLPFVTLKLAASLDGRIATASGASQWISSAASRRYVHRLRSEVDAVTVGAGTVRADDPRLTSRRRGGRDPLRVVVDGRLRSPLTARVLTGAAARGTLLATVTDKPRTTATLAARGVEVLRLPGRDGTLSLRRLLARLGQRDVVSVMIEGGAGLAASALREGVVDRLLAFVAPILVGGDGRPMIDGLGVQTIADALRLDDVRVRRLGGDVVIDGRVGARP